MKQINRYRIYGTVMVDVAVEVDAPTLEDAMNYVEDNYRMEEYANNTVGCEDGGYEFNEAEVTCCCDVEWSEDYSELVEEDVETYTDIWDEYDDEEDEDDDDESN